MFDLNNKRQTVYHVTSGGVAGHLPLITGCSSIQEFEAEEDSEIAVFPKEAFFFFSFFFFLFSSILFY